GGRSARLRDLLLGARRPHGRCRGARGSRDRSSRHVVRRDGRRGPRARAAAAAALPADGHPDRRRRRRRLPLVSRAVRRDLRPAQLGDVRVRRRGSLGGPDYDSAVKLPALTTGAFGAALALIFFYVPTDGDQGFSQRIFYFHVPIALTSYACFGWGAWKAL